NVATQVGTYTWHASYSGDVLNNGALDQGGAQEQAKTVKASPALVTTASASAGGVVGSAIPQDSAVLSGGYNVAGGTITFTLTAPNGGTAYTQVVTVTGPGTYTTSNANVATQVDRKSGVEGKSGDPLNSGTLDQ